MAFIIKNTRTSGLKCSRSLASYATSLCTLLFRHCSGNIRLFPRGDAQTWSGHSYNTLCKVEKPKNFLSLGQLHRRYLLSILVQHRDVISNPRGSPFWISGKISYSSQLTPICSVHHFRCTDISVHLKWCTEMNFIF